MVLAKSIFLIPIHFKVTHTQTTGQFSKCHGFPNVPKQHASTMHLKLKMFETLPALKVSVLFVDL